MKVGFELQQLKLDLQVIVFADPAGFVAHLAEVHGLLKALQILLREFERRFGELHVDELRGDIERKLRSLSATSERVCAVMSLAACKPVLPFLAALEQIAEADIELRELLWR